jgi:AcrR family transcriptional regulator
MAACPPAAEAKDVEMSASTVSAKDVAATEPTAHADAVEQVDASVERAPAGRPQRADAKRNRDALLAAAVVAFSENGVESSLEDIAQRAGVGIGTLYRNFPTREALIEAVYRNEVEKLCDGVAELQAELPAAEALAEWMQRFVAHVARKRGMAVALKQAAAQSSDGTASELFAYAHARIRVAMSTLLDAGVAAGTVRSDVDPMDLIRAMSGICLAIDQPGWLDQARRLVTLLMDGMRYGAGATTAARG